MDKSVSLHIKLSSQNGAALIVVLFFLILITAAGVLAVRQSNTDLRLATSDQISSLLLQSADNANQNIELSLNGSADTEIYDDMIGASGPFGHFILDDDNMNNEFIFCFQPRKRFFNINESTIVVEGGGTLQNTGYCNPTKPSNYTSERNAVMAQVNISRTPGSADDEVLGDYVEGKDVSSSTGKVYNFDINTSAFLPSFTKSTKSVTDCIEKTSKVDTISDLSALPDKSIGGCLTTAGIPNNVMYEQAEVQNKSLRTECVEFGKGAGLICTLPGAN